MKLLVVILSLCFVLNEVFAVTFDSANQRYYDQSWTPQSVAKYYQIPGHPFMAKQGQNNMHSDSYITDTYDHASIGASPVKVTNYQYRTLTPGQCAGQNFDDEGNIYTVCIGPLSAHLKLIDKNSLKEVASYDLPARKGTWTAIFQGRAQSLLEDSSGGAYFYLDHQNRAVIATANREILVVGVNKNIRGKKNFELAHRVDLRQVVPSTNCPEIGKPVYGHPNCDKITTALPDFAGNIWFISRFGRIGIVPKNMTAPRQVLRLSDGHRPEEIQNSFAVARDAIYIVSDRALYRLEKGANGVPEIKWRHAYDYGHQRRPGMISQGSGTTPTLLGDDYVAITDNAFPQMKVLVFRTQTNLPDAKRLVCEIEAFTLPYAGTENSLIGINHSLIVENNYGYIGPFNRNENTMNGLARIDFDPITNTCTRAWENTQISSPTPVPKFSYGNGLIYLYTRQKANQEAKDQDWYLTTVNYADGQMVSSHYLGTGYKFNNNWSAISLAPLKDGQNIADILVGTFYGLIKISPKTLQKK